MRFRATSPSLVSLLMLSLGMFAGHVFAQRRDVPPPSSAAARISAVNQARGIFQVAITRLMVDGDVAQARAGFVEALKQDPTYSLPRYNLAIMAEADENWEEAIRWFEDFLRLDPDSEFAAKARIELAASRRYSETDKTPEGKLARRYNDAIKRALVYSSASLPGQSLQQVTIAQGLDDKRWESYAMAGDIFRQQRLFDKAIAALRSALERAPQTQWEKLQQSLNDCSREWQYDLLVLEAIKLSEAKDYQNAAARFSQAWQMFPERGEYAIAAASCFAMTGDIGKAAQILKVIQDYPEQSVSAKARALLARMTQEKLMGT